MYYHVYNRGVGREDIFFEERNYAHFLDSFFLRAGPAVHLYAYCLLKNHFHLLVRIKTPDERPQHAQARDSGNIIRLVPPAQHLSNFFNGYAKSMNKGYERWGALFQHRFKRKALTSDASLVRVTCYIHCNPQIHGFVNDFQNYKHSSYRAILDKTDSRIRSGEVLDWFGGSDAYKKLHEKYMAERFVQEDEQEFD